MTDSDPFSERHFPGTRSVFDYLWRAHEDADALLDAVPEEYAVWLRQIGTIVAQGGIQLAIQWGEYGSYVLPAKRRLLEVNWIRYATELAIAEDCLQRGAGASERITNLESLVTQREIPLKAKPYLSELSTSYAYGLHLSCIAMSRAALEQALKDQLVAVGQYTWPQIRREKPSAFTVLQRARQTSLVNESFEEGDRLITLADEVLHTHPQDEKVRRQRALDAIDCLIQVLVELFGRKSP